MSRFQLVLQNPTIDALCAKFPHLKRFRDQGYVCDRDLHRDDVVGVIHYGLGRSLGVNINTGKVCAI